MLKDAVSIPGISMTYVLNKAIKTRKTNEPAFYAPGDPCNCKCEPDCKKSTCDKCFAKKTNCKIQAYELLKKQVW